MTPTTGLLLGFLPRTFDQARTAAMLAAGALLGWLVTPAVWVLAGPFRFVAMVLMTGAQESAFTASAVNAAEPNGSTSWGALQFNDVIVDGDPLPVRGDWVFNPFWVGFHAARFVGAAPTTDWRWLLLALPGSAPLWRWLWTHGPSSAGIESALGYRTDGLGQSGLGDVWSAFRAEKFSLPAAIGWRVVSVALMGAAFAALSAAGILRLRRGR